MQPLMSYSKQKTITASPTLISLLISLLIFGYIPTAGAGVLPLADNALEVISAVQPNILILTDDSGSMDLSIMATGPDSGNDGELSYLSGKLYSYAHPAPGASGLAPATNIFTQEQAPTEEHLKAQGVAAPYIGVWRVWNKDFNRVYYNPDVTYRAWIGLNKTGTAYTAATPTSASYNPYDPTQGGMNLTAVTANYATRYNGSAITATGFYPARYYTWTDSDADGYTDAGEPHQLIEIRSSGCTSGASCPSSFIRKKYSVGSTGRSDCATDNGNNTVTCSYSEEIQNFANWFSYYRKRALAASANFGFVIDNTTNARVGYATINNNDSVGLPIADMNISVKTGNKKLLMDRIYKTRPNSGTPLKNNLKKAGLYYECQTATDIFSAITHTCPVAAVNAGGACQQHFTVLMTDGFYNGSEVPFSSSPNKDLNSSNDFDGGATADIYSNTLADVAMDFYERDLQTTLVNDVDPTTKDINRSTRTQGYPVNSKAKPLPMHQHMTTYTVGFGVAGSLASMPASPTAAFTWPDPSLSNAGKIDDLRHAAYNGRGDFLQATDPVALQQGLETIFQEIGQSGGAASAVAFNTQNVQSDSLVFRAFFDTKLNTGDLVAQRVNLNGTLDPNQVWSAAAQLDSKTPASRILFTYKDTGASSAGLAFQWNLLTTGVGSQQTQLNLPQPANVGGALVGSSRLDWIRGDKTKEGKSFDDGQFRERAKNGKLGDLVHSAPVFVGAPPFIKRDNAPYPNGSSAVKYSTFKTNNKTRKGLVYVGSNDGMLHAFEATTGKELFGYIPNLVFQNLSQLTKPDYVHQFYVDLTPSISDAFINGSWSTVLVGGLGKGGKGYYALNITDPTAFSNEASAASKVMWEFTETDDGIVGNSDLGYSYSKPTIVMTNETSGGQKRWAAIFGNGYNSTSTDGDATLYVVFLDGGTDGIWTPSSDFVKISTQNGKAESADGSTPNGISGVKAVDKDSNGTVDYVYAGDLQGNLYRFNLTYPAAQWANQGLDGILYTASYGSPVKAQPITTEPFVINHPSAAGYIVVFGTGSWITTPDQTSTEIQSIYGIWDDLTTLPGSNAEVTQSMLVKQAFQNQVSQIAGYTLRTLSNNDVVWNNDATGSDPVVRGWHIDLDVPSAGSTTGVEFPGERAVRNLQYRGGLMFVNSIIPKSTAQCSDGAGGFELAFNPLNGGSGSKIIFDLNGDGVFDIKDNVTQTDADRNIVTGIRFDDSTPADSSFIGNVRVTQTDDKSIRSSSTNTNPLTDNMRQSWREIKL